MNEKLNIQDFVDLLAEKHGMSKKNADSFVKEFFQLIEEALERDKYVKVKGLGTFKLIDVESRESVNVNTGERFEIQGHTKVSFTPEPILKDIINKPFSHFETVVLNDDTVLEDTPLENESEDDEEVVSSKEESIDEIVGTEVTKETDISETIIDDDVTEITEVSSEDNAEPSLEKISQEEIKEVPVEPESFAVLEEEIKEVETIPVASQNENTEIVTAASEDTSTMKYFIGIVVFVVALCGGAIIYLYYPNLFEGAMSKPPTENVTGVETTVPTDRDGLTDSIAAKDSIKSARVDTVAKVSINSAQSDNISKETSKNKLQEQSASASATTKEQKKPVAAPFKPDSVGYTIVGTETTYTIQEGETLTKVALRFYGTKTLWPYIVKHNPDIIKNPDNVPFGTIIKIPKLVKKQ